MALAQHTSVSIRFDQQYLNAKTYLLPFLSQHIDLAKINSVMEIGCGEGGVLKPFIEKGIFSLGVDLSPSRIKSAQTFFQDARINGKAKFLVQNVYEDAFLHQWKNQFDLILLKDTIEHIPNQEQFIPYLKSFLAPNGKIFFGFPPWRMPFGGHQQLCNNKLVAFFPYLHLTPTSVYKTVLKLSGEKDDSIKELLNIKDTGISIKRFEQILKKTDFKTIGKKLFLINPIYHYKFGLKPREQFSFIANIPYLKDFVTTAGWYVVMPNTLS